MTRCPKFYPRSTVEPFLANFDPALHGRQLISILQRTFPSTYDLLQPTDPVYHRILLEARSLQTILQTYNHEAPLRCPTIYHSRVPNELPIVIDTGASCSVTPKIDDFLKEPTRPDTDKMEGLNGQCTEVVGAGTAEWDIEDINGNRDTIQTNAYFVPKANIRLFSPQVYIHEQHKHNHLNCNLLLNQQGIHLTLDNGNILTFTL